MIDDIHQVPLSQRVNNVIEYYENSKSYMNSDFDKYRKELAHKFKPLGSFLLDDWSNFTAETSSEPCRESVLNSTTTLLATSETLQVERPLLKRGSFAGNGNSKVNVEGEKRGGYPPKESCFVSQKMHRIRGRAPNEFVSGDEECRRESPRNPSASELDHARRRLRSNRLPTLPTAITRTSTANNPTQQSHGGPSSVMDNLSKTSKVTPTAKRTRAGSIGRNRRCESSLRKPAISPKTHRIEKSRLNPKTLTLPSRETQRTGSTRPTMVCVSGNSNDQKVASQTIARTQHTVNVQSQPPTSVPNGKNRQNVSKIRKSDVMSPENSTRVSTNDNFVSGSCGNHPTNSRPEIEYEDINRKHELCPDDHDQATVILVSNSAELLSERSASLNNLEVCVCEAQKSISDVILSSCLENSATKRHSLEKCSTSMATTGSSEFVTAVLPEITSAGSGNGNSGRDGGTLTSLLKNHLILKSDVPLYDQNRHLLGHIKAGSVVYEPAHVTRRKMKEYLKKTSPPSDFQTCEKSARNSSSGSTSGEFYPIKNTSSLLELEQTLACIHSAYKSL